MVRCIAPYIGWDEVWGWLLFGAGGVDHGFGHSAVDYEVLAGDETGGVGDEVLDHGGDVFGPTDAADGMLVLVLGRELA